jgi:acetyltransferase-like isoleucine patch superfamily enzyme
MVRRQRNRSMAVQLTDEGPDNDVALPADTAERLHGRIVLRGGGNSLRIGAGCSSSGLNIELGPACSVSIGEGCSLGNLFIYLRDAAQLSIGPACGFNGLVRLLLHEPARMSIGAGCLFAGDVDVTVSDMHSILDDASGRRINPARDIVIEDRVWIGQRAMVLKGAHIMQGAVIGACAVVSGAIPAKCVAAGVPARVVRHGVTWVHTLL